MKVKEEVLSDIRQRDDDPVGYTFTRFNEVFYKGHPYSKDPMGTEKDVENTGIDEVKALYNHFVSPSHAVIAISGDVDEKEVFRLIKEYFSGWKGEVKSLRRNVLQRQRKTWLLKKRSCRPI